MTTTTPAPLFAIIELYGRERIAGEVSEHQIAGHGFIRVTVPAVSFPEEAYVDGVRQQQQRAIPAHTRDLGPGSVFSINWCDEAAATMAAHLIRHQPIKTWDLREGLRDLPLSDRRVLLGAAAVEGSVDTQRPF